MYSQIQITDMNHYIFLVDNSYSMNHHLFKIVSVINEFLKKLKDNNLGDTYFTLASFSCNLNWIVKKQNVNHLDMFYVNQFINSGNTALYDSVCTVLLDFGLNVNERKHFYIITDGDDNNSDKHSREETDRMCNIAITNGNWEIKHFDTLDYNTLSVPKVQFDIDNMSDLFNNLTM
jgi:hypothetical protein